MSRRKICGNHSLKKISLYEPVRESPKTDLSAFSVESAPSGDQNGWLSPWITGGPPGSACGLGSSSAHSLRALGGKSTISRDFCRPFPLSFCATGSQHRKQTSYSFPSISFRRQFFALPHRSQVIMDPSRIRPAGPSLPLFRRTF